MNKDLKVISPAEITTQATQVSLVQNGDNATQIAHVGNYHDTSTNLIIQNNIPVIAAPMGQAFNRDYYNLFIVGGEKFTQRGSFIIPKNKALTENVSEDLETYINELSPQSIEQIKSFPSIFANENSVYGQSDNEQIAYFGIVEGVEIQSNGIKIFYCALNGVYQKKLNELKSDLNIKGHESFNEFDRTNWSIKKIDLISVLRNAGIIIYA